MSKMANEKRLIDANALIDDWNKAIKRMVRDSDGKVPVDFGLVIREISKAPTVDAVEVVRCKNCKHFGGHGACHCHAADENGTPIWVSEDDFCSYGRRKGDGNA